MVKLTVIALSVLMVTVILTVVVGLPLVDIFGHRRARKH